MIGTHSRSTRQDSEYAQPRCFARTLFRRFLPYARSRQGLRRKLLIIKRNCVRDCGTDKSRLEGAAFVFEWPVTGLLEDFRVREVCLWATTTPSWAQLLSDPGIATTHSEKARLESATLIF